MANAVGDSVFTKKVTCTSSDQALDMKISRNQVVLVADAECFINFDADVTSDERFVLPADTPVTFGDIMVRQLHYLADTGTPNIYVMAYISTK